MTWHLVPDAPAVFTETPIPAEALRGLRHKQAPNGVTVVAHDYATWREMRKRGMVVPSPLARYDWPSGKTPWPHQISTAEFLLEPGHEWCLVANGLGLGKTHTALWAADYLMKQGEVRRALIVAPLSVCSHVWARTIFTDLPHRKAAVAHGPADKRKLLCADKSLDFVIVNHDGLHIIADTVASEPFDLIIYDEATAVKTTTSRRWKTLARLRTGRRLWMMTGTPTPQSPLDAYGLLRLLRRDRPFGFAQWRSMTMEEASRFKWKARESSERTIATWLQPATRYRSTEVFDVQYEDIEVDLSPEQARLCSELKNAAAAQLADAKINVANAAALLSKILQVQCLAYDTQVLTEAGWKRICDIKAEKVWDGEEFVQHGGAVKRGVERCLTVRGLRLTADHLILTSRGWVTANDAREEYDWPKVRLPDGIKTGRELSTRKGIPGRCVAVPMRLRRRSGSERSGAAKFDRPRVDIQLWMPSRREEQEARHGGQPSVSLLASHEAALPRPEGRELSQLRRTRDNCLRRMAGVRRLLARHAARVRRYFNFRADRQRRAVLREELPVGDVGGTATQSPSDDIRGYAGRPHDSGGGSQALRNQAAYGLRASAERGVSVWDIVNCGPRNRFVVRGATNEVSIVHNCGGVYCHDPAGERVSRTVEAKAYFDEIVRFISEADTPVLVFAPFQAAVSAIHKAISDAGFPAGLITGAVPQKARVPLFDGVLSGELRALVAVPETMSHGLTLTTARYVLWCAPPFKAESYEQANGRVIRPGQRNGVVIAHIVPSRLVRDLYSRLKSKGRLQDAVLQLLGRV